MTQGRTHNDVGAKVTAIVDDAIAELLLIGLDSRNAACFMMAAQAALRIDDNEKMKELEQFVHDSVWDFDDLTGGAA
jgi:hypothetical protein